MPLMGKLALATEGAAALSCWKGWFSVTVVISLVHSVHVCLALLFFFTDKRVLSSLKLQMSLYFNTWFFPFWWISESVMLHVKVKTKTCRD